MQCKKLWKTSWVWCLGVQYKTRSNSHPRCGWESREQLTRQSRGVSLLLTFLNCLIVLRPWSSWQSNNGWFVRGPQASIWGRTKMDGTAELLRTLWFVIYIHACVCVCAAQNKGIIPSKLQEFCNYKYYFLEVRPGLECTVASAPPLWSPDCLVS
jgi:hypothetical protein